MNFQLEAKVPYGLVEKQKFMKFTANKTQVLWKIYVSIME